MQTARLIMVMVLVAAILLEVVGFLGAEGWLLHHHLKLLWCVFSAQLMACTVAVLDTSLQYNCCVWMSRGFAANGILLIFYASPLSSMLKVLQMRSSAPIHLGMAVMTVLSTLR